MTKETTLIAVNSLLQNAGVSFIVIGATARDLLAENFGVEVSERSTEDVDFAVLVESFDAAEKLRKILLTNPDVTVPENKDEKVRYYFKGAPFDLVPFGGIADSRHIVSWPPHHDSAMTVLGYSEALENALEVVVDGYPIRILSVEFFVALKLVAWGFNGARERDILDIAYILKNYSSFEKRAYEFLLEKENGDVLLDAVGNDVTNAEIVYLGCELSRRLSSEAKAGIIGVFSDEEAIDKMTTTIVSALGAIDGEMRERLMKKYSENLHALVLGLNS